MFERALADAQAAEALAHAGELDAGFSVSVNATATMLQDEEAVGFVIDAFRARGLDAGRVVVEATEREALLWDAGAHDLLRRVADAGMPLAIDDFSMGRTSFQYLETSVFSVVKLDGTIAKGVMENERYAEIVSSIADLSEHLGFTVLAEYVETAEQRDVLKTLGCSLLPRLPLRARAALRRDGGARTAGAGILREPASRRISFGPNDAAMMRHPASCDHPRG